MGAGNRASTDTVTHNALRFLLTARQNEGGPFRGLPIADSLSIRPYYMLQSVDLPAGWKTNEILGISVAVKLQR